MLEAIGLDADAAAYWGLARMPFNAAPPVAVTLPSSQHAEALARIEYLAARGRGCGAVTGPRGCGKSSLLAHARKSTQRMQRNACSIDAAGLDEARVLWELAAGLGLGPSPAVTSWGAWQTACDALLGCRETGDHVVLLVDHVEQMPESGIGVLLRLLRNPELSSAIVLIWAATAPLIGIVRSDLWPLADLRIELDTLSADETETHVQQSLGHSGASRTVFDEAALESVHARTSGELRRIDRLCRFALLAAMADDQTTVSRNLVEAAAVEFA
jgi:type II secretory pathway predicted ATPase ExeA